MPEVYEPENELVIGGTGTGKTYWVMYKMLSYMERGIHFVYIDPKGDGYWKMLGYFQWLSVTQPAKWAQIRSRVIFVNPVAKGDYLVSFNAIEPIDGEFADAKPDRIALVANNLTSHIRRTGGFEANEAMRMQNFLAAGIATLVQGGKGAFSIAEFPWLFKPYYDEKARRLADYNPFVESLLPAVTHYGTRFFWETEWPTMLGSDRREWVQSSLGRIFPYVFDERCLWTTCAVENARLNFREIVERGYWVFVNLPYYYEDDPVTTLIGNILLTKIYYRAMQRAHPTDFRIILDEARFFNTGPLDRILETGRFKKLWLTLIVQSISQLGRRRDGLTDASLIKTATNNVRYWSVFRDTEREDVEYLSWLMFRTTGQVPSLLQPNGTVQMLPPAAEQDLHARRFVELQDRNVILFDKERAFKTYAWWTPHVPFREADPEVLVDFEGEEMRRRGVPAKDLKAEIEERQAQIKSLFEGERTVVSDILPKVSRPSQLRRPQ